VDLPTESYDVIVMWNVLEHLAYPVRDLVNIISLLKPGGWLVFSVPNIESIEARLFGRYWVGWDLPRHLYIFPQHALNKILHDLGLRIAGIDNVSTGYSLLGHSLDFWSQDWDSQMLRKIILRAYYNPIARFATAPFLWLLDRTNKSTLLTYFAQKLIQET
jgi:SAM-dependent methyltransferase